MKSYWAEHKGKRVFIADYSGFGMDANGLRQETDRAMETLQKEPPNSVLTISNVTGTTASLENIKILESVLPHTNKHVKKRCVIGVEGMRWYFVDKLNEVTGAARLEAFSNLEEALEWIIKE